jgi:transcriptional regulator with XRE-family HTH domain
MRGAQIRELRERMGLTQQELADTLAQGLDRKYDKNVVSRWERETQNTPEGVAVFLDKLAIAQGLPGDSAQTASTLPEDTAPDDPGSHSLPGPSAPIGTTSSIYARTCEQLWESVAVGVGSVGALLGSQALMVDGQIIEQDKKELGRVWGQLAETNETFRKMLVGLSAGGAGLQVALVTGTTLGKMLQNHNAVKQQMMQAERENGDIPDYAAADAPFVT